MARIVWVLESGSYESERQEIGSHTLESIQTIVDNSHLGLYSKLIRISFNQMGIQERNEIPRGQHLNKMTGMDIKRAIMNVPNLNSTASHYF